MKTLQDYRRWLTTQQAGLETTARYSDCCEQYRVEEIVDEARRTACRFMADLGPCEYATYPALAYVSRILRQLAPSLLSVREAAERLNVSPRAVYDLCEAGRLKFLRVGIRRGTIRIRPADLDRIPLESACRLT